MSIFDIFKPAFKKEIYSPGAGEGA